ncbi:MAG: PAS domain S-box protein [Candidatus Heimdallarchaeota archaeon]|nr:PAS domain S-box protein [Candidatus Heimdallarchaeota archaeon]MCK5047944.1 PAS domain S-box protein [Candidatus Heimdallarchaeota archaeon]
MTVSNNILIKTLIVSNDDNYLTIVKEGLKALSPNLVIYTQKSSKEIFPFLDKNPDCKLIISETMIGEISCIEMYDQIKLHRKHSPCLIIFSRDGNEDIIIKALNCGIFKFIKIENSIDEALISLSEIIKNSVKPTKTIISYANKSINGVHLEGNILKEILNNSPYSILMTDTEGQITYVNSRSENLLKVNLEADSPSINRLNLKYIDLDGNPLPKENHPFYQVKEKKEVIYNIKYGLQTDQMKIFISATVSPLLTEKNEFGGAIFYLDDITDRISIEQQLKQKEERYRKLFEDTEEGILLMKGAFFVDCNPKILQIFKCTREQILSNTPIFFSPEKQPDGQLSETKALNYIGSALDGNPQKFEWKHIRYDGTPFDARVYLTRIEIQDDFYLQVILQDISMEKKAKEREELYKSMFRHNMRNKLILITGYSLLAEETVDLPDDLRNIIENIMQETDRSIKLLEQYWTIRDVDLIEETLFVSIKATINETLSMFRKRLEANNIVVENTVTDTSVQGGPFLVELFDILIENALIHSECSKITISSRFRNGFIDVFVEDDGKGIPEESSKDVFMKGVKGETSIGTGLGLYLIKRIIESYGGQVILERPEKGGARFILSLRVKK